MKRILLISDTHSHIDEAILKFVDSVDEVWHAGDIGDLSVTDSIAKKKPLKAVFGNIDNTKIRSEFPKDLLFEEQGVKVFITHIGGYPPKYNPYSLRIIEAEKPQLFICGHSHITKVMFDSAKDCLHMNPGAAGHHGFHKIRTMLRFSLDQGKVDNLEVIELGKR